MLCQIIAVKLKASVQLNVSLHIHPFTNITEEPIHSIDKCHTKQWKLENHFILIDGGMQHIATYLPTRATNFVMYQCIITSARIQYPTAAWLSYNV